MKTYLSAILSLALATCTGPAYADAVIFSGNDVKALKANLDLNGQAKVMSGTVDPTSSATSAPVGSIYLNTSNGNTYRKLDAGSSTNWQIVGSAGSAGINYVSNSGIETAITGFSAYSDAAGVSPVDGTGGSPASTIARTTTVGEVLRGTASAEWTKSAANRQGEGFSTDIKVDPQDNTGGSKAIIVQFDYLITGTYVDDDMQVFAYDKDGATVLGVFSGTTAESGKIKNCATTPCKFMGVFYTTAGNDDYRIIWHTASTSASAYSVYVDNVRAGPDQVVPGAIVTAWTAYTPTFSGLGTVTSIEMYWRQNGDNIEIEGNFTTGTTTASEARIGLPGVYTSQAFASIKKAGTFNRADANTNSAKGGVLLIEPSVTYFTIGFDEYALASSPFTKQNGSSIIGSTQKVTVRASTPAVIAASASLSTIEATFSPARARYTGVTQAIPSATATILNASTKTYDNFSAVTTGASWKFTAQKPGFYKASAVTQYVSRAYTNNQLVLVQLFKNGSFVSQGQVWAAPGTPTVVTAVTHTDTIYLLKGDFIDFRAYNDGSVSTNTDGFAITIEEDPEFSIFSVYGDKVNAGARAHNSATSISGTLATIVWTTEDYDSPGALSAGVYTCPYSGKYQVNTALALSGTFVLNNTTTVEIQKNGTAWGSLVHFIAASVTNEHVQLSDIVNCSAGETLRVQAASTGTTPAIVSSDSRNFLSISYMGQ